MLSVARCWDIKAHFGRRCFICEPGPGGYTMQRFLKSGHEQGGNYPTSRVGVFYKPSYRLHIVTGQRHVLASPGSCQKPFYGTYYAIWPDPVTFALAVPRREPHSRKKWTFNRTPLHPIAGVRLIECFIIAIFYDVFRPHTGIVGTRTRKGNFLLVRESIRTMAPSGASA